MTDQARAVVIGGGVNLADTPERLDWLRMVNARGRYLGIETEMISAAEAARRLPIVDPAYFVGAMADTLHGHVDPSGVTHAYAKAAVAAGAQVRRQTWARSIDRSAAGDWRIGLYDTRSGHLAGDGPPDADRGFLETPHVVNAGGLWAREVGRMVGVELPVLAMEHMYVLTEPISEVIAHNERTGEELIHCIDFGGEIYLRQEGQGLLVGTYEQAAKVWQPRRTPWDFDRRLLAPDLERLAPSLATTPVYDTLRARGAVFGDSFGLEVPLWFAPRPDAVEEITFGRSNAWPHVREEVRAVRNAVGLMESSGFAKFVVEGPQARAWLSYLVAASVPPPGRITLSPMCNAAGHLAGDLTIACLPPAGGRRDGPADTVTGGATANTEDHERFVVFGSGVAERYYERWFDTGLSDWERSARHRGHPSPSVGYRTLGAEMCGLAIAGPRSRVLLAGVTDADTSDEAMRFSSFAEIDVGLARVWCGRLSYTGALGYELWMPTRYQRHVFTQLTSYGDELGLRLFGSHALNSLRLEKSFGSWAREYRPVYDPFEAGLSRFVRMTRPGDDGADFVGREALAAKYGPAGERARTGDHAGGVMALRTWTVDVPPGRDGVDAVGDGPIWCDGEPVGWVTSGGYAHHSEKSVAIGYVPAALATEETAFEVELVGTRRRAHLVDRCLWDPDGLAMRG